jgi:hypothetical protein
MNPVELGQGTFPLSEAATEPLRDHDQHRLSAAREEQKLVNFDFKAVSVEQADGEGTDCPASIAHHRAGVPA